jgi:hypothetical protein
VLLEAVRANLGIPWLAEGLQTWLILHAFIYFPSSSSFPRNVVYINRLDSEVARASATLSGYIGVHGLSYDRIQVLVSTASLKMPSFMPALGPGSSEHGQESGSEVLAK